MKFHTVKNEREVLGFITREKLETYQYVKFHTHSYYPVHFLSDNHLISMREQAFNEGDEILLKLINEELSVREQLLKSTTKLMTIEEIDQTKLMLITLFGYSTDLPDTVILISSEDKPFKSLFQ